LFAGKLQRELETDDNEGRHAEGREVPARQMSGGQSFFIPSVTLVYSQSAVLVETFPVQKPLLAHIFPKYGRVFKLKKN
jgi:hypothetical protein